MHPNFVLLPCLLHSLFLLHFSPAVSYIAELHFCLFIKINSIYLENWRIPTFIFFRFTVYFLLLLYYTLYLFFCWIYFVWCNKVEKVHVLHIALFFASFLFQTHAFNYNTLAVYYHKIPFRVQQNAMIEM